MNSKKNKLSAMSLSRLGGLLPNILLGCMMLFSVGASAQKVSSPDGNLSVVFSLTGDGVPTYQVSFKGKQVIKPSTLGYFYALTSNAVGFYTYFVWMYTLLGKL